MYVFDPKRETQFVVRCESLELQIFWGAPLGRARLRSSAHPGPCRASAMAASTDLRFHGLKRRAVKPRCRGAHCTNKSVLPVFRERILNENSQGRAQGCGRGRPAWNRVPMRRRWAVSDTKTKRVSGLRGILKVEDSLAISDGQGNSYSDVGESSGGSPVRASVPIRGGCG